jgi:glycerol-3-phosphate dehydrogenase (NAD(P)+)
MNSRKLVLIIGAGEIGQAIGHVLRKSAMRPKVLFWDANPKKVPARGELDVLVARADFVFLCVPTLALRQVCRDIEPHLASHAVVVSLAKGVEPDGHFSDDILGDELGTAAFGVLGGPLLALELLANLSGVGSFGSTNARARYFLQKLFAKTPLRLELFEEARSVAVLGVLKNVYSVAISLATAMAPGDNAAGYYSAIALKEMTIILGRYGCEPVHVLSAAGAGDLIATSRSPHSLNAKLGRDLAKGKRKLSSEGSRAIPVLAAFLGAETHHLPLFEAVAAVLQGKTPASVLRKL